MTPRKFSRAEGSVLHQGQGNPKHRLGREGVRTIPGQDLGVLADEKLHRTQQGALLAQRAKRVLGCSARIVSSRSRERILPLYSPLLRPLPAELPPALGPSTQEGCEEQERVQRRPQRCSKGWRLQRTAPSALGGLG